MSLPSRIGKFEIVRRIGKGTMGEVFLGRDSILGREVAIKTILANSSFGEEAKARFEREARSTAVLNHPNIVTVYEFGEEEGLHFLAMEYLDGEDLETLIQKKILLQADCLEVLAQVCEGLGFAHEHGVVHRDIKPANILVTRRGKRILAKITDFGVALVGQSNLTQKGIWMGTANYMAPEYLDSGKATPSADLFAVGVMLYEVLSGGRRPFAGETTTMVLNAILRKPPEPFLPEEIQGIHPSLLEVVKRALAKVPEERFPSAEALGAAIREGAEGAGAAGETMPRPAIASVPVPVPIQASKKDLFDRPLIVGKGGKATCLSLRAAIRQAAAGARITVLPGHYKESLVVDKDLLIVGEGDPAEIILESTQGPCLTMRAGNASVIGISIRRGAQSGQDPVVLVQSGRASLEDCSILADQGVAVRIEGNGAQVLLDRSHLQGRCWTTVEAMPGTSVQAVKCMIEGFTAMGFRIMRAATANLLNTVIKDGGGMGLHLESGAQAQLEDCEIQSCQAGSLDVETEGRALLRRCRLESSKFAGVIAFEKSQVTLEECDIHGHGASGLHAVEAAIVSLRKCFLHDNQGFGLSVMDKGLCTLEECDIHDNAQPGVFVHQGGTVQIKNSKLHDGQSLGVVCAARGRGVLEDCEIYGNAQSGAKVEKGGSLLLVRCVLRDGRDTGMLLFEDAELTLEECVVHRNARGGILLAKDASDPILRGGNQIEDDLLRANSQGGLTKLSPVKRR